MQPPLSIELRQRRDPNVSIQEICDRFDVSKATIYCYVDPDEERRQ